MLTDLPKELHNIICNNMPLIDNENFSLIILLINM